MKHKTVEELESIARSLRMDVVRSLALAGSGHLGGSLGLADVFTVLYFDILNHRPSDPDWSGRDRLIVSIGHIAPVYYAALAHAGYFDRRELKTLRALGSRLQGHPGRDHGLPGIELSAGSLGQGLSVAVGLALAFQMNRLQNKTYCLMGDGELQEGSVWEAAMAAAHHKLYNLTAIVDRNGVQIDGPTEKVMALEPLRMKWEAFGWEVLECDGNQIEELLGALKAESHPLNKPRILLANTRMGKGVRSIEGDYRWHGKAPDQNQAERFLKELEGI